MGGGGGARRVAAAHADRDTGAADTDRALWAGGPGGRLQADFSGPLAGPKCFQKKLRMSFFFAAKDSPLFEVMSAAVLL